MPIGPHFRASLLAVKDDLSTGRERLRQQHERGTTAVALCARQADAMDSAVLALFDAALTDLDLEPLRGEVALVPHGGYGRRDVAPYSDLDLMILHEGSREEEVARLAARLMQDFYDVGLSPGHSVRTPLQAVQLAKADATVFTSLVEARFLAGGEGVYRAFVQCFRQMSRKRFRSVYESVLRARREERSQYGETVYLLRPNIKRSRGGLRDMQLLRWIGFAAFGTPDPEALMRRGALSREDCRVLKSAAEFLLHIRNDLHFHADKAQDLLDRGEQVRLAERYGYSGSAGLLPVEQFMRDYFRHTSQIRYLVARFVKSMRPKATVRAALSPIFSHQVEGDYRVGPQHICATKQGLLKLKSDLGEVLRLADLANLYDKRIEHSTWEAVCHAAPGYSAEISDDIARRFLSLLSQPARLGELLHRLHELGVLEKIVPPFAHAKCLLQFNDYHKYTVDEHCIRSVEAATDLNAQAGPLGEAYRAVRQRRLLHLALLLHDLGKGYEEDHSEVGLRIAEETCRRLNLSDRESEMVQYLVHRHLTMVHLAFRRDTSDERVVVRFAADVGSPEMLRMLFVLSCADLAAVGPGVLNSWKTEVLTELYQRALQHLTGNSELHSLRFEESARDKVGALLAQNQWSEWGAEHLAALPASYLQAVASDRVLEMFERLKALPAAQADAWGEYQPESETIAYTIIVAPGHVRGVFSRLTGALTGMGLEILSADINSLAGDTILDRFVVRDTDFSGAPPADRIEAVCAALVRSVVEEGSPRFRRVWETTGNDAASAILPTPPRIRFDNTTSSTHTILDIFTVDHRGLLYAIACTLLELGVSIGAAKISTHLDQVVDVFYITCQADGKKIEQEQRLQEIRTQLLTAIEKLA
jgi:[protein-PII] uridylyltransferase